MIVKSRSESEELKGLRYLNTRMELPEKTKYHLSILEKGYEGELKFDQMADHLQEERYILNGLLLEWNGSTFQLDKVIISESVIHLLDTKYYSGDYYWDNGKLYYLPTGKECKNPIEQLNRGHLLFKQLIQSHKLNYLVESFAVFVHSEFTLYQAPKDLPIILPTQVNRFLSELNNTKSVLNDGHRKLAQTLIALNQSKNPYEKLPEYSYEQLQKGMFCKKCKTLLFIFERDHFVCGKCGEREKVSEAILRNVEEYKFLFPERKITTSNIQDWCRTGLSHRTLTRVLKKHYLAFGKTSNTYYE